MIRIHFIGLRPDRGITPLASALGLPNQPLDNLASGNRYAEFIRTAHELFEVTTIDQADVCVYPHEYLNNEETAAVARVAEAANLPMVFFRQSDNEEPANPPYGVVYRDSILASQRTGCEEAIPAFCDDPLIETEGKVTILPKKRIPEVAFCGYVSAPLMLAGYLSLGRMRKVVGLALRRKSLSVLVDSPKVRTHFIERYQYWGGSIRLWRRRWILLRNKLLRRSTAIDPERDTELTNKVYHEFQQNLLGSPYNVCIRGAGNFTYRFYETLAAGRIPLFIDTECVLPFSDKINWLKHCVWVNVNDIKRSPHILARFHQDISAENFENLQQLNRQLWEDWLTPQSFYVKAMEEAIDEHHVNRHLAHEREHPASPLRVDFQAKDLTGTESA